MSFFSYFIQARVVHVLSVSGPGDLSLDEVHYGRQCIVGLTTDVKQGHESSRRPGPAWHTHSCGNISHGSYFLFNATAFHIWMLLE